MKPTGQAVTVYLEVLTDPDGVLAASFEQDTTHASGGSFTVASGVAQSFDWTPRGYRDCRVRIVAGATAPTDLDGEANAVPREAA